MKPETRYARSGDANIAYQVVGEGALDLVYVGPFVSHLEVLWEEPFAARFFSRLASFSRLILLDKRGTGLSDSVHVAAVPDLEQRMDDVRAVMDAAGCERAAFLALSESGPMCLLFAATYPERTAALVLWSTFPKAIRDAGCPEGVNTVDEVGPILDDLERQWRSGGFDVSDFADTVPQTELLRVSRWWAKLMRMGATPGAVRAIVRMATDMDVRPVLSLVAAPTLAIVRSGDVNAPATRYIADHIPGARYVEFPGHAHIPFIGGDQDAILAEIEEFLTGIRRQPEPDRILATVLFTDIVGSTARAAEIGDRSWRSLVELHHARVRGELARFGGFEIDTAGDGFFASFDGPARAIRCAGAIVEAVDELGLEVRAGVHTGECVRLEDKLGGIAVHVGARVAAEAAPGEVLVSQTVRDIVVGSGLELRDRGVAQLKGVPGEWRLFAVERDPEGQLLVRRPAGRAVSR